MAQQMKELVFERMGELDGNERLRLTPRRAWGICYGYILREMHVRKMADLDWLDTHAALCDVVEPGISVIFNLVDGREVHVDNTGLWIKNRRKGVWLTHNPRTPDLEDFVALARWYGPFDQPTLERFYREARETEIPHVIYTSGVLEKQRQDAAETRVYGRPLLPKERMMYVRTQAKEAE